MENAIVDYMLRSNDTQYVINDYIENDPLSEENLDRTLELVNEFHLSLPQKTICIYSGYTFEDIMTGIAYDEEGEFFFTEDDKKLYQIISQCDVLVDGQYIDSQRDITLPYLGSKNQKLIDVK